MFDGDRDGVLAIKEFERLMAVLGRAGIEETITLKSINNIL